MNGFDFEEMYCAMDAFMKAKPSAKDMDEANVYMDEFMKGWNEGKYRDLCQDDPFIKARKLKEEAFKAKSKKAKLELLEKALEVNPLDGDIVTNICDLKFPNNDKGDKDALPYLEEAESRIYALWEEETKDKGDDFEFYLAWRTRPYMRLLRNLFTFELEMGNIDKGLAYGEKALSLNEGDNLGFRYLVSKIYLAKRDFKKYSSLHREYEEGSALWIADAYVFHALHKDKSCMRKDMAKLREANPYLAETVEYMNFNGIPEEGSVDSYSPGSPEEAMTYIQDTLTVMPFWKELYKIAEDNSLSLFLSYNLEPSQIVFFIGLRSYFYDSKAESFSVKGLLNSDNELIQALLENVDESYIGDSVKLFEEKGLLIQYRKNRFQLSENADRCNLALLLLAAEMEEANKRENSYDDIDQA